MQVVYHSWHVRNTYFAEEMTTECWSELRIFVRWAATESSYAEIWNCKKKKKKTFSTCCVGDLLFFVQMWLWAKGETRLCGGSAVMIHHLLWVPGSHPLPQGWWDSCVWVGSWSRRSWCSSGLTSWCWPSPASPGSVAAECRHHTMDPSLAPAPDRYQCPGATHLAGTTTQAEVF